MLNIPDLWLSSFPKPQAADHKYDRGTALAYGGATITGAARLAVRAAQRVGAGLVTLACAETALAIYAEALESVIVKPIHAVADWQALVADPKQHALLIGPGMGLGAEQKVVVLAALATQKPCVLDADALTNFADEPDVLLKGLHSACVLTPHEGEFQRLFGAKINHADGKAQRAGQAARLAGCTVLLKGAETIIAAPDTPGITNTHAAPWLATGGSGDVLAGLILGLIAQKMPGFLAAAAAAWLHGDIALRFGRGLIAEDIVAGIPAALQKLLAADDKKR